MRNVVSAVLCLALAAAPASAQATPWAQKVFFGVANHDFGTVPRGAQLKHRFKMKNIYAVPLEVTNIRSTCGCLTATPNPKTLQPQQEGWIDVTMDGRRFTGHKTLTLYITVGPEYVSTAAIVISANARADVVFNPGQIDFGVVRQGQTPTQTIDIEYAGSLDWRVLEVVKNAEAPISVSVREMYREQPRLFRSSGKVGYQIAVTLKPDVAAGPFRHELILKTNDPVTPVLTAEVEGNVQAPLTVAPSVVRLGGVKMGKSASQKVAVRGTRPFRILSVEGAGEGLTVTPDAQAAPNHFLAVEYRPMRPGEFRRELRVRTDLDGGTMATLTVEATAEP
jgi:hypothetical protein